MRSLCRLGPSCTYLRLLSHQFELPVQRPRSQSTQGLAYVNQREVFSHIRPALCVESFRICQRIPPDQG